MAKGLAKAMENIARRPDYHPVDWRMESSVVTAVKRAYREATKVQKSQLRGWMREVLTEHDAPR